MDRQKTIGFFPEAAYGPALNSVGIAQACKGMGHDAVFLTAADMAGTYAGYGFSEHIVNMAAPMAAEEAAQYWQKFINDHIPDFNKSPYDQIDNYVRDCWAAIVDTAIWAQKDLPRVLEEVHPDLVCVDNVVLFPAIKQYGRPWVRVISCSENEIPDPDIPPHLSGCGQDDKACFRRFENRFNEVIAPIHKRFNELLTEHGEEPYPIGQFFETSPYLNLLLYPEAVKFTRSRPLNPQRFQYLEGCVRQEEPYTLPEFRANKEAPLVYVSFGSLGSGDTTTLERLIQALGGLPIRALVNVGGYLDVYKNVPANVILGKWFPQPSVIAQVDAVIHHGGNNTFTECLYFGKPSIIMPYVWDGHDNATRVQETGHGIKMHRSNWRIDDIARNLNSIFTDRAMKERLLTTSAQMKAQPGPRKAALLLDRLLRA
ncbi:MAG: glycosyltransferase [Acidobacteria bacterium]|nr:glycosyltransferase [Acidobacteriota bacterium]